MGLGTSPTAWQSEAKARWRGSTQEGGTPLERPSDYVSLEALWCAQAADDAQEVSHGRGSSGSSGCNRPLASPPTQRRRLISVAALVWPAREQNRRTEQRGGVGRSGARRFALHGQQRCDAMRRRPRGESEAFDPRQLRPSCRRCPGPTALDSPLFCRLGVWMQRASRHTAGSAAAPCAAATQGRARPGAGVLTVVTAYLY